MDTSLADRLVSSVKAVAAGLTLLKNSSNLNSVSTVTDQIMATKWSQKMAAFEGRLDEVDGRLDKIDVTNSTKAAEEVG